MSDILKIEYDLTPTLTALLPPPMQRCCQAYRHCPQVYGHTTALAMGAPAAAAALSLHCLLRFLHCRHRCAVAAVAMLLPLHCHRRHAAATTILLQPPCCRCCRTATAALPAAMLPLQYPPRFCCHQCHADAKLLPPPLPPPRLPLRCCAAAPAAATLPPPPICRCWAYAATNAALLLS